MTEDPLVLDGSDHTQSHMVWLFLTTLGKLEAGAEDRINSRL